MTIKKRPSTTDRKYPYESLIVFPTGNTISFTCRSCKLGQEGKIYRDVRHDAFVKENPPRVINPRFGKYEFVFCFACNSIWRINDWRRVSGLRIFDRVVSMPNPPNLIGGQNLTTGQPSLSYPNIINDPSETIFGRTASSGFYSPRYYQENFYET